MKNIEDLVVRPEDPDGPSNEERLPTHSPDGVDLTLIRSMLAISPLERLHTLEMVVYSISQMDSMQAADNNVSSKRVLEQQELWWQVLNST